MSNIEITNKRVLHRIRKAVRKKQSGLSRLFLKNITEEGTKKVTELYFKKMEIADFNFLRYFPNLEILTLSNVTGIKDTNGLAYCVKLKELMIYDTYIEDFEPLTYCSELEYFDYLCEEDPGHCAREDFRFLRMFPKLYQIDLTGNKVKDISFLSGHPRLKELVLDENPIRTIAPLKTIKTLEWLEVSNCGLSELEDIEEFSSLKYLRAVDNKIPNELIARYKERLSDPETEQDM